jgi:hypothetical protein
MAGKTCETAPQISKTLRKLAKSTITVGKITPNADKFNKTLAKRAQQV